MSYIVDCAKNVTGLVRFVAASHRRNKLSNFVDSRNNPSVPTVT